MDKTAKPAPLNHPNISWLVVREVVLTDNLVASDLDVTKYLDVTEDGYFIPKRLEITAYGWHTPDP